MVRRHPVWIASLLLAGCGTHADTNRVSYEPLSALEARFGTLITTGNHPTPDQHGTGDRIGLFRDYEGTVWGLPLSITGEGAVVGCAPVSIHDAAVTGEYPAGASIIGSTNEPTGWRGGTGKLELVLRGPNGDVTLQSVNAARLPNGPACWAQIPPGPKQELFYYRLKPANQQK